MGKSLSGVPWIPAEARLGDRIWFKQWPDRRLRLRRPVGEEYLSEFRSLGPHAEDRRRVIVARLPASQMRRYNVDFMRIPFLLFADEAVEDTDEVLGPILRGIMEEARG